MADVSEERKGADVATLLLASSATTQRAPATTTRQRRRNAAARLAISDTVLAFVAFAIAYWMRYQLTWPAPFNRIIQEVLTVNYVPFSNFLFYAALLIVVLMVLFTMKGLYRLPRHAGVLDYAGPIISATTTGIAFVVLIMIVQRPIYSRLIFAFAWGWTIILLLLSRAVLVNLQRWRWTRGLGRERVLVIGGTGLGRQVMDGIVAQTFLGYSLVGYLEDRDPPPNERRDGHFRHLGAVLDLPTIIRPSAIELVIIALPFWEHHRLPEIVRICRAAGVEFRVVPEKFGAYLPA